MRSATICLIGCVLLAGCAADPALQQARDTVALSSRMVEEAAGTPVSSEVAPEARRHLETSVQQARRQVKDAEQTVDLWQSTGVGRLGWETLAPCLGDALDALSRAMQRVGVEPPAELDQAVVMARSASEEPCRHDSPP